MDENEVTFDATDLTWTNGPISNARLLPEGATLRFNLGAEVGEPWAELVADDYEAPDYEATSAETFTTHWDSSGVITLDLEDP